VNLAIVREDGTASYNATTDGGGRYSIALPATDTTRTRDTVVPLASAFHP
jgi:hypothetical protein